MLQHKNVILVSVSAVILAVGAYFIHSKISELEMIIMEQQAVIEAEEQKDFMQQIVDPVKDELRQIKESLQNILQQKVTKMQQKAADVRQKLQQQQVQAPVASEPKKNENSTVIEINSQQDLQNLLDTNKQPAVLFFHMNGCGWCRKMDPIYDEVADNSSFKNVKFYKIEGRSSQAPALVEKAFGQKITGYPTIIFVNKNGYVDKQVGFAQKEDFEAKIKKYVQK